MILLKDSLVFEGYIGIAIVIGCGIAILFAVKKLFKDLKK